MEAQESLALLRKRRKKLVLMLLLMLESDQPKHKRRKHSIWMKPWFQKRHQMSAYNNILKEFRLKDAENYRRYLRMNVETYEYILNAVRPLITKKKTKFREPISPEERLVVTLRFLATGETQHSSMTQHLISESSIGRIIPETCWAILAALQKIHMPFPNSEEEWKSIIDRFYEQWNFPHCIGAVDGKHIAITCPANTVSEYHNYKGFYSIILMALVDADYKFINVIAGAQGRNGDSGVFTDSEFYKKLVLQTLKLPKDARLLGEESDTTKAEMLYVIVADDAFPLSKNIMKPYAQKGLTDGKRIFNYRLSRARRTTENAFGILVQTFRAFLSTISLDPGIVELMVLASCVLHNILRDLSRDSYTPTYFVDLVDEQGDIIEGQWRHDNTSHVLSLERDKPKKAPYQAEDVRDHFKEYFQTTGSVQWQYKHIYTNT